MNDQDIQIYLFTHCSQMSNSFTLQEQRHSKPPSLRKHILHRFDPFTVACSDTVEDDVLVDTTVQLQLKRAQ